MCGRHAVHPSVRSIIKRTIDLTVAGLGLILLAPAFAAIALVVYLAMGRPVLFRQVRSGYRSMPFVIYKFRTMREARGIDGEPLPDAERLTGYKVGGIGPFGQKRKVPTAFDETIELYDRVYINAGQRGLLMSLAPTDAVRAAEGTVADLCA